MTIKRGDIYYADLRPVVGSEQGGIRPVLIIQNDVGNIHSPTVICAAITSQLHKAKLPTHVSLDSGKLIWSRIRSYCWSSFAPSIRPDLRIRYVIWIIRFYLRLIKH